MASLDLLFLEHDHLCDAQEKVPEEGWLVLEHVHQQVDCALDVLVVEWDAQNKIFYEIGVCGDQVVNFVVRKIVCD